MRYILRLEELPDARRFYLPQAHVRAGYRRHRPRVGPAVAVEHRQRPQVVGVVVHPDLDDVAQSTQVRTPVRVHYTLRLPRRAGRIVDRDGFLFIFQHTLDRIRRAPGKVILVRVSVLAGIVHAHDLDAFHVGKQMLQLGVGKDHLRPRVLDDVGDLILAQAGVDRHQHVARSRHPEVRLQHRWDIRAEKRNPISLLESFFLEP